ncbi:MAG: hypothetical protein P8L44_18095 [Opitutales bacterium]|nr:hypothetical protein [Opitutales bacterium]
MKLSENVEVESNETKASNSRASRLARYSTAAAGVAAVSTLDVDAAMIKVIVTDPLAADSNDYILDLSAIAPDTYLSMVQSSSSFVLLGGKNASVAFSAGSSRLYDFDNGSSIGGKEGKAWQWSSSSGWMSSSSMGIFGFRINQGSSDYTYGWVKANIGSSSFTLNSYGYNDTLNEAAIAGQGSAAVPDSGPGVVGLALLGAGAAGMRLLRKLRAGK